MPYGEPEEEEPPEDEASGFEETPLTRQDQAPFTGRIFGGDRRPEPIGVVGKKLPPIPETITVGGDAPPPPPEPPSEPEPSLPQGQMTYTPPAPPPPPPVDEQILEEARRKAGQMISQAQEHAQQMLSQMAQQAQEAARMAQEQARQAGQQAGYHEGREEGLRSARAEFAELFEQARSMYLQAIRERRKLIVCAEPELARLATKIAERILGQELKSHPETILGVVQEALEGIKDREEVVIRVHPDDVEMVRENRTTFERMVEGLKRFEVLSDRTIDPGGCTIETNLGNIDARLATRLTAVQRGVEEIIELREKEIAQELETDPPPEEAYGSEG